MMASLRVVLVVFWVGLAAVACSDDGGKPDANEGPDPPDNAGADGGGFDDANGDNNGNNDPGDDAGGEDAGPPLAFEEGCLFGVVGCFEGAGEALSCTINLLNNQAGIAYERGLAVVYQVNEAGQFIADTFAEENVCYTAQTIEASPDSSGWLITVPNFENQPLRVDFADGRATVTCIDGTEERFDAEVVRAFLPQILTQDDPLCVAIDDPQCSVDIDCEGMGAGLECCRTADTGRCLDLGLCPEIPVGLTGCLKETMDCFGSGRSPVSCEISRSTGERRVRYSANREARINFDRETLALTIEASNNLGVCFVAEAEGMPPFARMDITNVNSEQVFPLLFQGGRVFVDCDEMTTEQHPEDFVLRNLPALLDEGDELCELVD